MNDPAHLGGTLLPQDAHRVVVRRAKVDNQRKGQLASETDEAAERLLLGGPRGVVVVIVEAGFADRHHLAVPRQAADGVEDTVVDQRGLVWVYPHRGKDPLVRLGESDGRVVGLQGPAGADRHHDAHAGRPGALQHGVAIGRELGHVEMAVGVGDRLPGAERR